MREVRYPGDASDVVRYGYNRQGQTKLMLDQYGTAHAYSFNKLGAYATA